MKKYWAIFASLILIACTEEPQHQAKSQNQAAIGVKDTSMTSEQAKRRVIRAKPVVKKGVRYEELRASKSRGFQQNGGVLVAINDDSGEELWTLQIYQTIYDEAEETDVQDVFIKTLKLNWRGTKLTIENERGKTFEVDLESKEVTAK